MKEKATRRLQDFSGGEMSYVYVITDDDLLENIEGYLTDTYSVKIGYTSGDIDSRLSQLQTGNPRQLLPVYLYTFDCPETARAIERLCHHKLKESRLKGEWFLYGQPVFELLNSVEKLALSVEKFTAPNQEAFNIMFSEYKLKVAVANG